MSYDVTVAEHAVLRACGLSSCAVQVRQTVMLYHTVDRFTTSLRPRSRLQRFWSVYTVVIKKTGRVDHDSSTGRQQSQLFFVLCRNERMRARTHSSMVTYTHAQNEHTQHIVFPSQLRACACARTRLTHTHTVIVYSYFCPCRAHALPSSLPLLLLLLLLLSVLYMYRYYIYMYVYY